MYNNLYNNYASLRFCVSRFRRIGRKRRRQLGIENKIAVKVLAWKILGSIEKTKRNISGDASLRQFTRISIELASHTACAFFLRHARSNYPANQALSIARLGIV